jgi:hypothetical protein
MRHLLLNILTATSMVLCVAMSLLLLRSLCATDLLSHVTRDNFAIECRNIVLSAGCVSYERVRTSHGLISYGQLKIEEPHGWQLSRNRADYANEWWLWGHVHISPKQDFNYIMVAVPLWIAILLTSVLPAIVFLRLRRQSYRRVRGQCLTCGYNLTGNVSGTCPECGTAAPTRQGVV